MSEQNTEEVLNPELRKMTKASRPSDWVSVARQEESKTTTLSRIADGVMKKGIDWLRPSQPGNLPVPTEVAQHLTSRSTLAPFLNYRDWDDERNLMYLTASDTFRVGFGLELAPLVVAGTDIESQLEALITNCPEDTIIQTSVLGGTQFQATLDAWTNSRLKQNKSENLAELALRRREFFMAAAEHGGTLTYAGMPFQPRQFQYFILVTLPYNGSPDNARELEIFLKSVSDLRSTLEGGLNGSKIASRVMNRFDFEALMIEILNPQLSPEEKRKMFDSPEAMPGNFLDSEGRIRVLNDGSLLFSSFKDKSADIYGTVLTMDAPPTEGWLPLTSQLLGDLRSQDDRISCPFWLHTTIHVLHPEKAKERATMKLGSLNKQMMSDSSWFRSMMGHLFHQKEELDELLEASNTGHAPVRLWSGIVLYNTEMRTKRETEYVANLWRKAGFRCSQERFISLPVYLASLPMMYDPSTDMPGKGLQRAITVNSFNASTLMHVQGDWKGTRPHEGGPLMISRRGQLATIDLFQTSTNYNFVVVAQSGSGKSFFSNELVNDILSRNGVVRIFDVGRSYKRFALENNGTVLEFSPEDPKSLNPFSGITNHGDLFELMPVLKSLIRQMAFPLTTDENFETQFNWEYAALEQAIVGAWEEYQEDTGLEHVYRWMMDQTDSRYLDLAFQLHSYAVGRYAPWFNGPRQVKLDNDLIIVELEDLEVDPDLQAVVLTLMIHQITKDMYLSDPERKRHKLLLVDEGWRLLGDKQSGGFIAKAFRTVRKYKGAAGAITQSFADFAASDAARAALENASWQFVLNQKPESIDFAVSKKWLSDDPLFVSMLKSVVSNGTVGYSEVFIKGEQGQGIYRFITDRHSYWMYTTNGADLNKLATVREQYGCDLITAVDILAREDYKSKNHPFMPHSESLYKQYMATR